MDELKKQQDVYITKIFWLGLQISFIFAIPAVLGVWVGKTVDRMFGFGNYATIIALVLTFLLSWVAVILMYMRLNKKLKEVNQQIKENNHV